MSSEKNGSKPPFVFELPALIGLVVAFLYEAGWIHNYEYGRFFGLPIQAVDAGFHATLVHAITVFGSPGGYWQPGLALPLACLMLWAVHAGRTILGLASAAALFVVIPSWSQAAARQTVDDIVQNDRLPKVVFVLKRDAQELVSEVFASANARGSLRLLRQEGDAFHVFERDTGQLRPDRANGGPRVFVVPRSTVELVEIQPSAGAM